MVFSFLVLAGCLRTEGVECFEGLCPVFVELGGEGLGRGESLDAAEAGNELEGEGLSVEVFVAVDEVHFERAGVAAEGGAWSEVADGREGA